MENPESPSPAGLLLLTGGQGRRLGGPKHLQPHPLGGSWGSHLVDVFADRFPGAPAQLLGEPLPDRPGMPFAPDPRQGPAVALAHWASLASAPQAERWWVVACDQVRWTSPALGAWHAQALAADPGAAHWVLAGHGGHTQFLGGWLGRGLLKALAVQTSPSMGALAQALPTVILDAPGPEWEDVDTPESLSAWLESFG